MQSQITAAKQLLANAKHIIALTGAGISKPSGIPDFRSPRTGLWATVDPMEIASIASFRRDPNRFYDWLRPLSQTTQNAQPNAAHQALADLESANKLKAIITQNIDGLHGAAGSQHVLELHGNLRKMVCINCRHEYDGKHFVQDFVQSGKVPYCYCGSVLKPDVVLFGEMLPEAIYAEAYKQTTCCDLMLVAGSSLQTAPAGDLPLLALNYRAKLIIVNLEPTPIDSLANIVIHADVAEILPALAA